MPLPSNFKICECRTRALARRLNNMPDLLLVYNDIIKEQERRGFIEKIDSSPPKGPVHYVHTPSSCAQEFQDNTYQNSLRLHGTTKLLMRTN